MPLDRLRRKLTKENLWIYILSLLLEGPQYAYTIPAEVEKKFGWKPARITGYIVLKSLEAKGLVKMTEKMAETGKIRKYYEITEEGKKLMREAKEFLRDTYAKLFGESL
jgi:DNA-binding PadR family transcriptional regulator